MKSHIQMGLLASTSMLAMNSTFAANTINEAFANAKVKGEVKSVYFDSNFLGKVKSDTMAVIGGNLNYVTEDFHGLTGGLTFQSSQVLNGYTPGGVFTNGLNASGAALSESYLKYNIAKTDITVGRTYMDTPLVRSAVEGKSSERLLTDAFEVVAVTNNSIADTTITAAFVNKYQAQTNGSGDVGEFEDFGDGAYTLHLVNKSIENLTLQAQYLLSKDLNGNVGKDASVYFAQADYNLSGHVFTAQYYLSEDETQAVGAQDGSMYGIKATGSLGLGKLGYLVAFNASTDSGTVYQGAGAGTTDTTLIAIPVHGGGVPARRDNKTLVGAIIIPTPILTFIPYGGQSQSDYGLGDVTVYGAMAMAPIGKQTMIKAYYENVDAEKQIAEKTDAFRLFLSYKF